MARYFTSDSHFGDHRVINLYHRPFASAAVMDEALIAAWNAACGSDDEIWHLGDFARTAAHAAAILPRLNGVKHLVTGNNDPEPDLAHGWASVQPYAELDEAGRKLVLCHYPFRSWNGQHRGALNLHGHSHGRMKPLPRQFDVGVDVRGYGPVTLQALLDAPRPTVRSSAAQGSEGSFAAVQTDGSSGET
jgi:calcineurin-like phosphoesterase family protein